MPVAALPHLSPIANTDEGVLFSNLAEAKLNTIIMTAAAAEEGVKQVMSPTLEKVVVPYVYLGFRDYNKTDNNNKKKIFNKEQNMLKNRVQM